ncbi:MAG: hypothetical protein IJX93_06325 [Clostridia bacterium]|nr:hypothetical protein [Clostridia bacterium]MBQ8333371.1 hypothetical protein [Clostridia bacterium]
MTLGDILKGTLKVVGSAGLILVSGMAKAAANIAEENGNDSGAYDELSDSCMKQLDKMWTNSSDYEEPSESEEYRRQRNNIDKKLKRVEAVIKKTQSLAKEAEREGNTELYEDYMKKIEEYKNRLYEIQEEQRDLADGYFNSQYDDSNDEYNEYDD